MKKKKQNDSLGTLGERGFLRRFLPHLSKLNIQKFVVPPGDDAAVLKTNSRPVLSIDGLTEGTHFRLSWATRAERITGVSFGRLLGWKLLGRALSDLAAMGASYHRWAMIYLGAPPSTKVPFLLHFYQGLKEVAARSHCVLAGGDTTRANNLSVVAAVGAETRPSRVLRRSGAQSGDLICIAGTIGDASIGLKILEGTLHLKQRSLKAYFVRRFFDHRPLFKEAEKLSGDKNVTSLIDLSDALGESIEIFCESSQVGAKVEVAAIPVSSEYRTLCEKNESLLSGGEDYALLFTLHPKGLKRLQSKLHFSVIGQIQTASQKIIFTKEGRTIPLPSSFHHFGAR